MSKAPTPTIKTGRRDRAEIAQDAYDQAKRKYDHAVARFARLAAQHVAAEKAVEAARRRMAYLASDPDLAPQDDATAAEIKADSLPTRTVPN